MKGDASYVPSAAGPVNKLPNISAYNVSQDEIDWSIPLVRMSVLRRIIETHLPGRSDVCPYLPMMSNALANPSIHSHETLRLFDPVHSDNSCQVPHHSKRFAACTMSPPFLTTPTRSGYS